MASLPPRYFASYTPGHGYCVLDRDDGAVVEEWLVSAAHAEEAALIWNRILTRSLGGAEP
jgi:hypothetical protein